MIDYLLILNSNSLADIKYIKHLELEFIQNINKTDASNVDTENTLVKSQIYLQKFNTVQAEIVFTLENQGYSI